MKTIRASNVNEAYTLGIKMLEKEGVLQQSRIGATLELPEPASVMYVNPRERVLFDPVRDINPFLHFFEGLWILAGRRDAKFLADLVPGMAQYSDDGEVFYGSYGYRLRSDYKAGDQVTEAIERLKNNPNDRQVVLTIRRPSDMWYRGKDVPCFAGDTVLPSPEGDLTFAEVAAKFASGRIGRWPVYAVNPETGDLRIQWASNVWKSGVKKTIKITFDTGLILRITPDHTLYKKQTVRNDAPGASKFSNVLKVTPIKAGELTIGDRVLATGLKFKTTKEHMWVKKNIYQNTAYGNQQKVHRAYYELEYGEIEPGYDIHHIDENKSNNSLYNLNKLSIGEHSSIHRRGDANPMRNMTPEQHAARADKVAQTWQEKRELEDVVNHLVVKIEEGFEEDVYDFTVPNYHNALIGDGLVAHNCNLMVDCKIRDGKLNIQVFNRSNDFIWGLTGTNAVQFSMLQEYMAGKIGCGVGHYHQTTSSMHVYVNEQWEKLRQAVKYEPNPYEMGLVAPYNMMGEVEGWDDDLRSFFDWYDACGGDAFKQLPPMWETPFFAYVVEPFWFTWMSHKDWRQSKTESQKHATLEFAWHIMAQDWQLATLNWLGRRYDK